MCAALPANPNLIHSPAAALTLQAAALLALSSPVAFCLTVARFRSPKLRFPIVCDAGVGAVSLRRLPCTRRPALEASPVPVSMPAMPMLCTIPVLAAALHTNKHCPASWPLLACRCMYVGFAGFFALLASEFVTPTTAGQLARRSLAATPRGCGELMWQVCAPAGGWAAVHAHASGSWLAAHSSDQLWCFALT